MALTAADILFFQLGQNTVDSLNQKGIRLATMHRVKGLEFDYMYVAGMNDGVMPLGNLESEDSTIIKEHEQKRTFFTLCGDNTSKTFLSNYRIRSILKIF